LESEKGTEDSSSEEGYYYSDGASVTAQNFAKYEALVLEEIVSEDSDESSSEDTTVRNNYEIPVQRIPGSSSDSKDSSPIMLSNDPYAERPVFDSEAMSPGDMTNNIAKAATVVKRNAATVVKHNFIGHDIVSVESVLGVEGLESEKGTEDSSSEEGYYYSDGASVTAQNFAKYEALVLEEIVSEDSDESSSEDTTVRNNYEIPVQRIPGSSSDSKDSSPIMLSNDPYAERPVFDSEAMSPGPMTESNVNGNSVANNYSIESKRGIEDSSSEEGYYYSSEEGSVEDVAYLNYGELPVNRRLRKITENMARKFRV